MKATIRTFFILSLLSVKSGLIFGMHKDIFNGKKPSISFPVGTWEEADQKSIREQIALKRAALVTAKQEITQANQSTLTQPTITITNTGVIPFVVRTDEWTCHLPAHNTTPAQACTSETFLEILVGSKIGRYLVKDALGLLDDCPSAKKLTITIFADQESDDISAIFNDAFAISLEEIPPTPKAFKSLNNESDMTEITKSMAIDSPITSPKPTLEKK